MHAGGLAAADAPAKVTTVEGSSEYRLDNGLRVLLYPDASRPTVTINLTVFVGSRHQGYGETGMAHLLEHMVFRARQRIHTFPRRCRSVEQVRSVYEQFLGSQAGELVLPPRIVFARTRAV